MDDLIAVMVEKLGLAAEEITDILWLALLQWQSIPATNSETQPTNLTSASSVVTTPITGEPTDPPNIPRTTATSTSSNQPTPTFPLYQNHPQSPTPSSPDQKSLPFAVPNAKALRNSPALMRSLRPLMQRVPSQTEWLLDEEATVQCIAETNLWFPQHKPLQEPWLELALVVDASPSMLIWQRHILELQQLLAQTGAFRDVRTWSLQLKADGQLCLYPKLGAGVNQQTPRSPKELLDPNRRRLILVISDCISALWQSGIITPTLNVWAEHGLMALLQMLPEWLWDRTALSEVPKVRLHSLAPGMVNQKLSVVRRDRWRQTTAQDIKVPVLTLEPAVASLWSQMVAGKGNAGTPGLLFSTDTSTPFPEIVEPSVDLSAEERVQRFRAFSSPMARRLAGLLAACPVVSLPIIRMIQDAMKLQSQQVHIAEVLLSGLFQLATPLEAQKNLDEIEYRFYNKEIRQILLDSTPAPDTFSVLSKWIEQQLGKSIDDFIAILKFPQSNSTEAERIQPFAGVALEVLQRQGGEYARFAATASTFVEFPPLSTFNFEVATITIDNEDEIETPEGINLQPFSFEVGLIEINQSAEISKVNPIEIVDEMIFTKIGRHLSNIEQLLIEGTLANKTYKEIAISASYSEVSLRKVGNQLWKLSSEVFDEKVTQKNLQNVIKQWTSRRHITIQRRRQQANGFSENLPNEIVIEMVLIPGGKFTMGAPKDEEGSSDRERPQHQVTVPTFFMGKYPITQAQWQAVASLPQVDRKLNPNPSDFQGENRPVERVSWYDAVEFCQRLSQYTTHDYRLPSEAEWEYACRAGSSTPFHFGQTITSELANYNADYTYDAGAKGTFRGETTDVGHFGVANGFGLYDMHGNVWEWCLDHWHRNYKGAPTDGSAWLNDNDNDNYRLLRGGSWNYLPGSCRSAYRYNTLPVFVSYDIIGFRVVCAVVPRTLSSP